jgi:glutamate-5-semialdehyde dehydrogenase
MIMENIGKAAKEASRLLKGAATEAKNKALEEAARLIRAQRDDILAANRQDIENAKDLTSAQIDRLKLDAGRIEGIAKGIDLIATLPDPVGKQIAEWTVPSGLKITRVRVPLGVIGVIYESRPNVTADAAALCLKSGNACILRPGSECFLSSRILASLFQKALETVGLPEQIVQMVPTSDRKLVGEMLGLAQYIDVIIPRGGKSLTARVQLESKVPVLAHLDGNCHIYVDGSSDLEMAKRIALNAKMRRTGVCGAAETMLVDQACVSSHLAPLVKMLLDAGCEVRGDEATCVVDARVKPAQEADWGTEYLDAIIAVKVVDGVKDAARHVEQYGSHHTECIVTNDASAAKEFLGAVDSAIVLHNASTQFADGGEFGMGAEIGIATGRLHARGPVGLEELTTYKNVVYGNGQIRK